MRVDPIKWLAFAYWRLRDVFCFMSDDGLSEWKALLVICVTELLALMAGISVIEIELRRHVWPKSTSVATPLAIALAAVLTLGNYYVLKYQDRWKHYMPEFSKYGSTKRTVGTAIVLSIMFLSAIAAAFAGSAAQKI